MVCVEVMEETLVLIIIITIIIINVIINAISHDITYQHASRQRIHHRLILHLQIPIPGKLEGRSQHTVKYQQEFFILLKKALSIWVHLGRQYIKCKTIFGDNRCTSFADNSKVGVCIRRWTPRMVSPGSTHLNLRTRLRTRHAL